MEPLPVLCCQCVIWMGGRTHSRLQLGDLIPGLAELLQHLVQLVLHALTIHPFILKVLGGELDLRGKEGIKASART